MMFSARFYHLALLFPSVAVAVIYDTPSSLPLTTSYDFIVVGGGTAGCVIANRLTENPLFKVLVLEAGPTNEGALDSIVPGLAFGLANTIYDWNFTTTPQSGLNGRTLSYERGHVLGGSSSVNGMVYTRGSAADYNRWASITGDIGWSWLAVQPYIRKNEHWNPPVDHHNTTGQFNPLVHSFTGVNYVSLPGFSQPNDHRVLEATTQAGPNWKYNLDINSGFPLGLGWSQATNHNGSRSSAATSYLAPKYTSRPNLDIVLNTRVTRLLKTATLSGVPVFRTVEFAAGPTSPRLVLTAGKEVVLSAGPIGTPHILLHSGIGDSVALNALGINSTLNLPAVGKNLHDHTSVSPTWSTTSTDTTGANITEALAEWEATRMGFLSWFATHFIGFSRLPSNSSIFNNFTDPSPGPASPHLESLIFGFLQDNLTVSGGTVCLVTPMSRGTLSINSTDPFTNPIINLGLLTNDFDVLAIRQGIKDMAHYFASPAWDGYIVAPSGDFGTAFAAGDAALDEWIRNTAGPFAHAVGTAAMSSRSSSSGVVNPDLLVKGARGLRIVDASIMPIVTSAHTQAPTYIIAERAADMIKLAHLL